MNSPRPAFEWNTHRRDAHARAGLRTGGQKLRLLGAEAVELPVLRITKEISKESLLDVMLELGSYDWLVFTSANGVRFLFRRIPPDLRRHPRARRPPHRRGGRRHIAADRRLAPQGGMPAGEGDG